MRQPANTEAWRRLGRYRLTVLGDVDGSVRAFRAALLPRPGLRGTASDLIEATRVLRAKKYLIALKRRGELLRAGLRARLRYLAVQRAVRVIVPTRVVADDAAKLLRVDPGRISVVPEAAASRLGPRGPGDVASVRTSYGLPEGYLLWVGDLAHPEPRKRVAELAATPRRRPLVLVGRAGRWARELDGVTVTGEVPDGDLAAIYSGAHALVLPSPEEGFGLPAIEALACGTPVVAADGPALREVLDGRATFVEADDLTGRLAAAYEAERPAPAPPDWSWADAAGATWDVYERTLAS